MRRTERGFTLVEILIVVIILGILAAIVIPQFTEASSQARDSSFASDLQTLRSQIELYKVQHGDMSPADLNVIGDNLDSGANFRTKLTTKTTTTGAAGGTLGPYLQSFPTNPYATANGNAVSIGAAAPADKATAGWWWNTGENKLYGLTKATAVTWE